MKDDACFKWMFGLNSRSEFKVWIEFCPCLDWILAQNSMFGLDSDENSVQRAKWIHLDDVLSVYQVCACAQQSHFMAQKSQKQIQYIERRSETLCAGKHDSRDRKIVEPLRLRLGRSFRVARGPLNTMKNGNWNISLHKAQSVIYLDDINRAFFDGYSKRCKFLHRLLTGTNGVTILNVNRSAA